MILPKQLACLAIVLAACGWPSIAQADATTVPQNIAFKNTLMELIPDESVVSGNQLTAVWDVVPGAAHYLVYTSNDSKPTVVRFLNTMAEGSTAVTLRADNKFTYKLTNGDATYKLAVSAVDSLGNESPKSEPVSVKLDTIPPRIAIANPLDFSEITGNSVSIAGVISDSNLDHYYYSLSTSDDRLILTSSLFKEFMSEGILASLDVTMYENGRYKMKFIAIDKAGNKAVIDNVSETATFDIVRKASSEPITEPIASLPQVPPASTSVQPVTPAQQATTPPTPIASDSASAATVLGSTASFETAPTGRLAVTIKPLKENNSLLLLAAIPFLIPLTLVIYRRTISAT